MKVTELLRNLLDIIDAADTPVEKPVDYAEEITIIQAEPESQYSNSPDEMYTNQEVIDTMGNDVNGPVTPDQIKTATFPMFFGLGK